MCRRLWGVCQAPADLACPGRLDGQIKAGDLTRVQRILMLGIDIDALDEVLRAKLTCHALHAWRCTGERRCNCAGAL